MEHAGIALGAIADDSGFSRVDPARAQTCRWAWGTAVVVGLPDDDGHGPIPDIGIH
jgi:hypothetical protein